MLANDIGADGAAGQTMVSPTLGTRGGLNQLRDPAVDRLHFEGQAIFKYAVRGMTASVERTLAQAGLSVDDIDLVVPHQANQRIEATTKRLGVPDEKVMLNIATHGNTSAASVPMALTDALAEGRVAPGALVLQTAFGGGLTWGTNVMRWGDRVEPIATSDASISETDATVFDLLAPNRAFYAPFHDPTN